MRENRGEINAVTMFFMVLLHVGAIAALFVFSWTRLLACLAVWYVSASLGIGVCFHRLLTHRGFKTYRWVEYLLTIFGCLALQGGPIWWVMKHRKHHQFAEEVGLDPHTPLEGGFWAHMGWLMYKDIDGPHVARKYAKDLLADPVQRFLDKWHWLPLVAIGAVLLAVGGLPLVLWGACVPVVISWHSTWLVNSATHMWGSRRFETRDNSRNNWWVALLTFGEGWHNDHHYDPRAARHGYRWYEIDVNWYNIAALRLLGLVWDPVKPKALKAA